jgi:uncharacterized LabA/DUF88 family protein
LNNDLPVSSAKGRVAILIDGFNLYHAIDDCPHFHAYKWLDPIALSSLFVHPDKEIRIGTFFYTAVPIWDDEKRARHERLLRVYEDLGVKVKRGAFMPITAICRLCGKEYSTHAEKETDINIALEIMRLGTEDLVDRIVLITGDNDQAPSIRSFRALAKSPKITVVTPPFRHANELKGVASDYFSLSGIHLAKCQLANPYVFKNSASMKPVYRPPLWVNAEKPAANWRPRTSWARR